METFFRINDQEGVIKSMSSIEENEILIQLTIGNKTIFDHGKDQSSLWKTFSCGLKDLLKDDYDEEFYYRLFLESTTIFKFIEN